MITFWEKIRNILGFSEYGKYTKQDQMCLTYELRITYKINLILEQQQRKIVKVLSRGATKFNWLYL